MNKKKSAKSKQKKKKLVKGSAFKEVPLKFLLQNLNCPISILDSRKRKFIYVNPQFIQLTGLGGEELYNVDFSQYLGLIHAKDMLIMLSHIAEEVRENCSKYIYHKKQQLTYTINYRFKQKEGRYINVMVQNTVLEWDEKNRRSVVLSLYTDISNHKQDNKMVLTINVLDESDQEWKTVVTKEFLIIPEMLSEREREVMKLIVLENTAEAIAKKLGLKFYTARAHWRNILTKTGCKSQKELKELAKREGWV